MIRTLALLLLLCPTVALAADPLKPAWEPKVRDALVHVESVWAYRTGVIIGDGKTVWAYAGNNDRSRGITVSVPGGVESDATGYVYHDGRRLVWTLTPEKDLGKDGLELSTKTLEPGMVVYSFGRTHGWNTKDDPLVRVLVASVGPKSFTLAAGDNELRTGAPVLDADGRVLGLLTSDQRGVPVSILSTRTNFMERCAGATKIFGVRAGAEIASSLGGDATQNRLFDLDSDVATIFEIDLGVAIWDRLAFVGSIGFALGDTNSHTTSLPAEGDLGPAVVAASGGRAVRLGFDVQYRQLLVNSHAPLYLDFTVGGLYSNELIEVDGARLRSTDPGCDPSTEACPLIVQDGGDIENNHVWDMRIGADLRFGPLLVGYRFLPGLGDAVTAHQITIGLQGP